MFLLAKIHTQKKTPEKKLTQSRADMMEEFIHKLDYKNLFVNKLRIAMRLGIAL